MQRLLLLFITFLLAHSQLVCEDNTTCDDFDSCTGTNSFPDMCTGGQCTPGADVCPTYVKHTVIGRSETTGELQVTNDDKWLYLIWNSASAFRASRVFLFSSSDPLASDDPTTFPFQFQLSSDANSVQMRVSLDYLGNPTELDPIYLSLRMENEAGAGTWMSGYFSPVHHTHGGSYSYTSVCHCAGYSHVNSLMDYSEEIFSFPQASPTVVPLGIPSDSPSSVILPSMLLAILVLAL